METSYDEICKNVGALYLNLSSKLGQTQDQLSIMVAQLQTKNAEIEKLKELVEKLSANADK